MSYNAFKIAVKGFLTGFSSLETEICEKLKAEVEAYLHADESKNDLIKLLVISFNETARLGMDKSIPVLKAFFSFLRHRLIEVKACEYKRLILLLDAYIRNCGFRAQILIGRYKFLETISVTARGYLTVTEATCQECASLAFDCIKSWSEAFSKYRNYFPYYEATFLSLKNVYQVKFPKSDVSRKPIPIDMHLIAEKLKAPMKHTGCDDSESSISDLSSPFDELVSSDQYSMKSTTLSSHAVCYLQDRTSSGFWGSPFDVKY